MASSPLDDGIFAQLRKPLDPKLLEQREQQVNDRVHASYEKAEKRQAEILGLNATAPVTISSIRVLNANHTRHAFLERIFSPILAHNRPADDYYTLKEAVTEVSKAVDKLNRLDIFQTPISTFFDRPESTDPSTTPTDYAVYVTAKERGRYTIKTGTEAGTAEGSAYLNVVLRNLFGGGERLNGNASLGTRTRNAYSATFDTPVLSNPDLRFELGGLKSSTVKPWASHEEILHGGNARLRWQTSPTTRHDFAYNGLWRQITSLADNASSTVRHDAGDSFKSALSHTFIHDSRDAPTLPTRGILLKIASEVAGGGLLRGDVAHAKLELDTQAAVPIPLPSALTGKDRSSGIALTTSFRAGVLAPLPVPGQEHGVPHSRLNDRFTLGGPTDIRGFRLAGLGPRDGADAVGGDVFAAGSAAVTLPFPYVSTETPLRLQAFVNGGRLLALKDVRNQDGKEASAPRTMGDVGRSLAATLSELGNELPSAAAGFGVVYAHPAARVEVNFSLPLVTRKGEEGRKGLSFGVGIDTM